MNRKEHLLLIVMEECSELSQAASKAGRFNPLDRKTMDPTVINTDPSEPTNADKMEVELNQLLAVIRMLVDEFPDEFRMRRKPEIQTAKIIKVEQYLEYSRMVGTLSP